MTPVTVKPDVIVVGAGLFVGCGRHRPPGDQAAAPAPGAGQWCEDDGANACSVATVAHALEGPTHPVVIHPAGRPP